MDTSETARALSLSRPIVTLSCEHCGDRFSARNQYAQFCSDRCRKASKRAEDKTDAAQRVLRYAADGGPRGVWLYGNERTVARRLARAELLIACGPDRWAITEAGRAKLRGERA